MAATVTVQATGGKQPMAPLFVDRIKIEGDTSYPQTTGGYDLALAANLPGKTVIGGVPTVQVGSDWVVTLDRATGKAKVTLISTGAEVANGVDLALLDVEMLIVSQ